MKKILVVTVLAVCAVIAITTTTSSQNAEFIFPDPWTVAPKKW